MSQNQSHNQCPCKLLPLKLSTNTAAEYGSLDAIKHRLASATLTKDGSLSSFSEPLHIAAQHGHVHLVSYLLQKGYNVDSGLPHGCSRTTIEQCLHSTPPLHRACYTGALGCIKLLLDHGADLSIKDKSFGDEMTPLHKAVKGGRYHAVKLILSHVQSDSTFSLQQILQYEDKHRRTPLQLAKELYALGKDEVLSLRRWNQIAVSQPDFEKCIQLLEMAASLNGLPNMCRPYIDTCWNLKEDQSVLKQSSPIRSGIDTVKCFCGIENTVISTWEKSFTNALIDSTKKLLASTMDMKDNDCVSLPSMSEQKNSERIRHHMNVDAKFTHSTEKDTTIEKENRHDPEKIRNVNEMSHRASCELCNVSSVVLFRSTDGRLICSKCKRKL